MAKKWDDLVAERRAKMTPEQRAHSDGYSMGFKDAFETWEWTLREWSLWRYWKYRRTLRKEG